MIRALQVLFGVASSPPWFVEASSATRRHVVAHRQSTLWFHSDVRVSCFSSYLGRPSRFDITTSQRATSRSFNLSVSPYVIFISGPPQVQVGHTVCLVGAFLAASVRVCKSCGSYSFCDMAHQRCDVEQHIKSYGLRRAAKRDSDGWLVVSVGLFFGMWNIDVFAGQRVGVPSIAVWWRPFY